MLKWREHYLVGKGIRGHANIQARINSGKPVPGIWLLTLSNHPDNALEIVQAAQLFQSGLYDRCPEIIGMARGKNQAIEMVREMVEECYQKTGEVRLKEYLNNR